MRTSTALVPADPAGIADRTRLVRDIQGALAKLSTHGTRSQIAHYLGAAGHLGVPGMSVGCPVAEYLVDEIGDAVDVSVWDTSVLAVSAGLFVTLRIAHPEAVSAFVRRFDRGDYPELQLAEAGPPVPG